MFSEKLLITSRGLELRLEPVTEKVRMQIRDYQKKADILIIPQCLSDLIE